MKVSDYIFRYRAPEVMKPDTLCRIRTYVAGGDVSVVASDLGEKSYGALVSSSVTHLWSSLIQKGYVAETATLFVHEENGMFEDSFEKVTFVNGRPILASTPIEDVAKILNCTGDELKIPSSEDPKISQLIEQNRNQIDPFADFPYIEDRETLLRRLTIEDSMVSREKLQAMVEAGSTERDLQSLIKSDLSIIGEIYGHPNDEYIAFSELPLGHGLVDFAVFSGRSRMDVTLIEIKGADFPIVTSNSYHNFAAKFNEAAQQIRSRLSYTLREYEAARAAMHALLADVESGKRRFNSFVGPIKGLKVDPDKDVNFKYVVIAGRTNVDFSESRLRHDFERSVTPHIKVESWDSWLKKMRRR